MAQLEYICKCNNCGSILYDENPQIGAEKVDVSSISVEILPMELLNDGDVSFFGCRACATDAFLNDSL